MNTHLKPAGWSQAFAAWFWTNLFGLALLTAWIMLLLMIDSNNRGGLLMELVGAVGAGAAVVSLPIVPLAYFAFRYVLPIPNRMLRVIAAVVAIAAFFGLSMILLPLLTKGIMGYATFMILFVYLPASLAAHARVYRSQLFRAAPVAEASPQSN